MEIFSVVVGVALLAIGHVGWFREQDSQEDLVPFSLLAEACLWPCRCRWRY